MITLKTIKSLVEEAMINNYELRLHKNRHQLYHHLCIKTGKHLSPESIMRAQRKLWSEGLCLPKKEHKEEWLLTRASGIDEFKSFVKYGEVTDSMKVPTMKNGYLCANCMKLFMSTKEAEFCCNVGSISNEKKLKV